VLALGLVHGKIWRIIAGTLCVPAAALTLGGHLMSGTAQALSVTIGHAMAALFCVVVAGMITATIIKARAHSLDSVFGAICGYLLIGVAWAMTYVVIQAADAESFQMSDDVQQQMVDDKGTRNTFIYYSFVTLSTVGYGDLTPRSNVARTLAWLEAVTGQVYLAVVIAGLVSAMVATKVASHTSEPIGNDTGLTATRVSAQK
jgi:hypothetical protein